MGIFKRADSPYYQWKLQHKKKKYGGSTGTKNKSEALAFYLEQERLIKRNKFRYVGKTYGELVDYYLDSYHPNEQATLLWTLKYWKDYELEELSSADIKRLQEFKAMRVKASTVNRQFNTVRSILNRAVKNLQWMDSVPYWSKEIELEPNRKVLSKEEEKRLLRELPPHLRRITIFALETGLRKSTIVKLTMDMFDSNSGILTIPAELLLKTKKPLIIKLSIRARYLILELIEDKIRKQQFGLPQFHRKRNIFTYKRMPIKNPTGSAWKKAKARAGVNITFHELRHTWATRMLEAGMPEAQVAHFGGWTSTRMLKVYSHVNVNNFAGLKKFGY